MNDETKKFWSGAHTKHRLKYHLVFVPKYRRRVLSWKSVPQLKTLFYQACELHWWYIDVLAIEVDHVHMLIQLKPDKSIAKVLQILKGWTSRIIRKEYPELEEFLWWDSFWADWYFAESVWEHHEKYIREYISKQWQ